MGFEFWRCLEAYIKNTLRVMYVLDRKCHAAWIILVYYSAWFWSMRWASCVTLSCVRTRPHSTADTSRPTFTCCILDSSVFICHSNEIKRDKVKYDNSLKIQQMKLNNDALVTHLYLPFLPIIHHWHTSSNASLDIPYHALEVLSSPSIVLVAMNLALAHPKLSWTTRIVEEGG